MSVTDVQTDKYHVRPVWNRNDNGERKDFLGYEADHRLIVRVEDLAVVGDVVDAAIGAGAKDIGSVKFHANATDSLEQMALEAAVRQAHTKAATRCLSAINETIRSGPPRKTATRNPNSRNVRTSFLTTSVSHLLCNRAILNRSFFYKI